MALGAKFIVVACSILVAAMGAFAAVVIYYQRAEIVKTTVSDAVRFADTIEKSIRHDMLQGHSEDAFAIMETVGQQKGVLRVRLIDKKGMIKFSTDSAEMKTIVNKQTERCTACHLGGETLERPHVSKLSRIFYSPDGEQVLAVMKPIYVERGCSSEKCHTNVKDGTAMGVLDVTMSLEEMRTKATSSAWLVAVFALLAVGAMASGIAWLVRSSIHKPLRSLMLHAQKVAQGDLESRSTVDRGDEIGELAENLNRMSESLRKNVMEIRRYDESLERERITSSSILRSVLEGIVYVDADNKFNYINEAAAKIFGIESKQYAGRRVADCFDCAKRAEIEGMLARAREGEVSQTGFFSSTRPSVESRNYVVKKPDGTYLGVVQICRDRSEEIKLQRQLANTERMALVGEVAAGVAHEINNPLDGIQKCIRIMLDKGARPRQEQELLGMVFEGLKRIEAVVRHLLTFSRRRQAATSRVNINQIVEDSLFLVQQRAAVQNTVIDTQLSENLPPVRGDFYGLSQVVINLLINAIDSISTGGKISVVTARSQDGNYVQIKVSDTGCGISTGDIERIFDPFFTTKDVGKGTGLGLSVSRNIVEEHGGEISVKSTTGKGSTFTVTLPIFAGD